MSSRTVKQGTGGRMDRQPKQPLLRGTAANQSPLSPVPQPQPQPQQQAKPVKPQPKQAKLPADKQEAAAIDQRAASKLTSLLRSSDYIDGSRDRHDGWKSAIHQYVSLYNQAETEQHVAAIDGYVSDQDHCTRMHGRLQRLRQRDLLRGCLPSRGETKAELVRVNESATEVSVLVKLHIKRQMEQSGLYYIEERAECERLWLAQSGGYWQIVRIEPVIGERRPRFGISEYASGFEEAEDYVAESQSLVRSTPFLNYELFPQLKHRQAGIPYRRDLAAAYADQWWNQPNPAYEEFEVNCTNYTSQAIFAGNGPMNYTGKRSSGWWYKGRNKGGEWWSYSWSVSNALANYLTAPRSSGMRGSVVNSAEELQLGDIITYDWNGDGRFEHSTIVTAFDAAGMPLVNANTVPSRHRYWDYRDSYAWTEQTKYRFFHIADLL
ncbi:amidase domain-containing protein [Paenibacillus radicis (ex Gao et al. 2016)]|uniref:Putative amidase domain-containing protein n=1 Tax=Paenibacillus radicis (ex Gao et al. 2016) TaxID=1737354 RepID=A0A917HGG8_9BACL|nr:amidase domain-containing protein [Paenibacillus radicis (ex Gao et al. 2016)]GGG78079.1 hypothetical protein GCM10010918_38650 [Paenibacillus radicis (ex Gao et al. 2016)]